MSRAERRLEMTFINQKHEYFPGKVTPRLARECRRLFDMGPADLWSSWFQRPTIEADQVAAMLWLAKRQMSELSGVPDVAMTLDQLDDLITADLIQDSFTIEFKGFGVGDEDSTPEIDVVAEVDDDGHRVVAPDPEG